MDSEPPLQKLYSLIPIAFLLMGTNSSLIVISLIVIGLLIMSGLISGSEVAFYSLSPDDKENIKESQPEIYQKLKILLENPNRLLATILIANNFINIAIVVLSDYIIWNAFSEALFLEWAVSLKTKFAFLNIETYTLATGINLFITLIGVTTLLVLFGEVAPKIYAKLNNVKYVVKMTSPIILLNKIFGPLSAAFVFLSGLIDKSLINNSMGISRSKDDIDTAIDLAVNEIGEKDQKANILKGILHFNNVTAKQIMKSRLDVISLNLEDNFEHVLKIARASGFSRLPVEIEDFDHIEGIIYIKDLLIYLNEDKDFNWHHIINKDLLYIPETKKINELLRIFQERHVHMAIVVDEYGGSTGIVTLEDVMEEIIGEIRDEFDSSDNLLYKKINASTYIFEGKSLINDVCKVLELHVEEFDELRGDSDTLAGLILEKAGIIPKEGYSYEIEERYKFTAMSVSKRRIEKVKLELLATR